MELIEHEHPCVFRRKIEPASANRDAMIHLFHCDYRPAFRFWFGVLRCDAKHQFSPYEPLVIWWADDLDGHTAMVIKWDLSEDPVKAGKLLQIVGISA